MADPHLAGVIRVTRNPGTGAVSIEVDGEPFPWLVEDGIGTYVDRGDAPGVTLTIQAETVEIVDTIKAPG